MKLVQHWTSNLKSFKSEVEADVTAPPPDDDVVTESDAIEA